MSRSVAALHFICGKAGAGKTTRAREPGRTLPAPVFCEDEWIERLGVEVRSLADFAAASRPEARAARHFSVSG